MSVLDNYSCEGQMSIFDIFDQDILCGRMYQEPSAQTKGKTSEWFLKKFVELRIKPPQYLCLRRENGVQADVSWVTGGALLGEYTMHSFGESPKDVKESRLSQILEVNPLPKYSLSEKACAGILRRAEKRGKQLPEPLRQALMNQMLTPLKSGGGREVDSHGKKAGKGALVQTELSGTLGVSQDQTLVQGWDGSQIAHTLTAKNADGSQRMPDKDNFNAVITCTTEMTPKVDEEGKAFSLRGRDYKDAPCVVYGLDRASFNQGQNAQYDFSVEEEKAQTLVAKGPGGVMTEQ